MDPLKWREKAIVLAGETSKLLITLGTAFVAFAITFSDKLGGLVVDSAMGRWLLILVSGGFSISVGCGIWTQLALTQELEPKPQPGVVASEPSIRSRPVKTAFRFQVVTFVLATLLGASFVVWRIYQPAKPGITGLGPQKTVVLQEFFKVGRPLLFAPARAKVKDETMKTNLTREVCGAKKELIQSGSTIAIVVGRHDQKPLGRAARLEFTSNAGLAQGRAEDVARVLENEGDCGLPGIKTVIRLLAAPRYVGESASDPRELEKDREVTVYGVRPAPPPTVPSPSDGLSSN